MSRAARDIAVIGRADECIFEISIVVTINLVGVRTIPRQWAVPEPAALPDAGSGSPTASSREAALTLPQPAAAAVPMVPRIAELVRAARRADVAVVHALAVARADRRQRAAATGPSGVHRKHPGLLEGRIA
jgi:hypothetical protein